MGTFVERAAPDIERRDPSAPLIPDDSNITEAWQLSLDDQFTLALHGITIGRTALQETNQPEPVVPMWQEEAFGWPLPTPRLPQRAGYFVLELTAQGIQPEYGRATDPSLTLQVIFPLKINEP